jgi:hypothetical protein
MRARVGVFAAIRRDARVEGLSIRALAARHGVHRRTVRAALESAEPPERKTAVRVSPKLEAFKPLIDAMLLEDVSAPRKQRHTARRVLARLVDEHGLDEVSYSTVRDYVRTRRSEIDAEAGRHRKVFVPQDHAPGAEAEVDKMLDRLSRGDEVVVWKLDRLGRSTRHLLELLDGFKAHGIKFRSLRDGIAMDPDTELGGAMAQAMVTIISAFAPFAAATAPAGPGNSGPSLVSGCCGSYWAADRPTSGRFLALRGPGGRAAALGGVSRPAHFSGYSVPVVCLFRMICSTALAV